MRVIYTLKLVVLIVILCFMYRVVKYFKKKGALRYAIIACFILSIITSCINGSILGIFFWDGPYWGRVVDADTGKPIAGANVMAKWKIEYSAILILTSYHADAREAVTDEKGRFFVPMARAVWLWPLSRIYLDELNVYKPGYDSHPPRMQYAWNDKEKEKWRKKLNKLFPKRKPGYHSISDTEYFNNPRYVPGRYQSKYRVKCKIYKPTIIRLNKAMSVEEQWEATTISLLDVGCEDYKIRRMKYELNRDQSRLSRARRGKK
ncbi:MAG: carboxypeptidase regulatory-like domain-containing protein [Deltaproteobacteria bacterium]|nr:carboxypeptidase regulatory-like domain-containing protein [Deltaproteobacteria bacterium]MBW2358393.1 carboxypeptidase regulatory-like domain-containing protein [Deltaproteobacteria bacterium]